MPTSSKLVTMSYFVVDFLPPHLVPGRHVHSLENSTCIDWAQGRCAGSAGKCGRAHHLFPQIVWRASKNGVKKAQCAFGEECFWPPEYCGFSHEECRHSEEQGKGTERRGDHAFQQVQQERRRKVEELLARRDWDVRLSYSCRREGCSATFAALDELLEHLGSGTGCPHRGRMGSLGGTAIGDSTGRAGMRRFHLPVMTHSPSFRSAAKQKKMGRDWRQRSG